MPIRRTAVAELVPAPAAHDPGHHRAGGLTRRSLGTAAVGTVALLAGCADPRTSTSSKSPSPTATAPSGSPTAPADKELVTAAVSAERLMVEQLTAAAGVEPLARTILAARVVHAAHVELLDEAAAPTGPSPAATTGLTGTASPTGTGGPSPTTSSPAAPTATAAALARAERALVQQHTTAAVAASSGILARVLAAMAASAAQQAVALERLARQQAAAEAPS